MEGSADGDDPNLFGGSHVEEGDALRRRRRRIASSSSPSRRRRTEEKKGNDSVAAVAPPDETGSDKVGGERDGTDAIGVVAAADVVEKQEGKERPANSSEGGRLEELGRRASKDGFDPSLRAGAFAGSGGGGVENGGGLEIEPPPSPPLPSASDVDDSLTRHGATLSLLLLLHVLFFRHWNKRKALKELGTSYREIVRGKRFHRAPIALLSHPPAPAAESSSSSSSSFRGGSFRSSSGGGGSSAAVEGGGGSSSSRTSIEMGSDDFSSSSSSSSSSPSLLLPSGRVGRILRRILPFRFIHFVRTSLWPRLSTALRPLTSGSLSGLPLLLYDSHVIWSTRALESMHARSSSSDADDGCPWGHFRFLVALSLTSLLLELIVDAALLRNAPRYSVLTGSPGFRPYVRGEGAASLTTDSHDMILDRKICTPVRLAAALLAVHKFHFPYVPLRVFPFVSTRFNPPLAGSYLWCVASLALLGGRTDSYSGIIYGTTSGMLWSMGLTKFWGETYWGNWMMLGCALAACAGIKTEAQAAARSAAAGRRGGGRARRRRRRGELVPCVDYVGWRSGDDDVGVEVARGRAAGGGRQRIGRTRDGTEADETADAERADGADGGEDDRRPLLPRRQHGGTNGVAIGVDLGGGGGGAMIHGRVPLMSMDSELDGRGGGGGGDDDDDGGWRPPPSRSAGSARPAATRRETSGGGDGVGVGSGSGLSRRGGGGGGLSSSSSSPPR